MSGYIPAEYFLDGFNLNPECNRGVAASCSINERKCILSNGETLKLIVIKSLEDLERVVSEKVEGVVYIMDNSFIYGLKKQKGLMLTEYLREIGVREKSIVISGLHVIASWEFTILHDMEWGYVYLPIDAGFNGHFVPLYELWDNGVSIALGSGWLDAQYNTCDYRGVVWSAVLNQYHVLRDEKSLLGVLQAAVSALHVYGIDNTPVNLLEGFTPQKALRILYSYARATSKN